MIKRSWFQLLGTFYQENLLFVSGSANARKEWRKLCYFRRPNEHSHGTKTYPYHLLQAAEQIVLVAGGKSSHLRAEAFLSNRCQKWSQINRRGIFHSNYWSCERTDFCFFQKVELKKKISWFYFFSKSLMPSGMKWCQHICSAVVWPRDSSL